MAAEAGVKYDNSKPRWSLLVWPFLSGVVEILEYGAAKYPSPDNWKRVDDGYNRYMDAALRHLLARLQGEVFDPETGKDHLFHTGCCIMFAWYHYSKVGR